MSKPPVQSVLLLHDGSPDGSPRKYKALFSSIHRTVRPDGSPADGSVRWFARHCPKALAHCPRALGRCPRAVGKRPKALGHCPRALGQCPRAVGPYGSTLPPEVPAGGQSARAFALTPLSSGSALETANQGSGR
jgi:hypothetical protein